MGNCSYKGFDTHLDPIRVMTSSGQVLEFAGPKPVSEVIKEFPRYGLFRKDKLLSPLDHHELLAGGQLYHLFPLASDEGARINEEKKLKESKPVEPVRKSSVAEGEPVRLSMSIGSGFEVLPAPRKGVWKVKLVIDTKQLEEILAEEVNTEALIEQMRVAAASSTKVVPRQSYWGVKLKPILCNVMNKMVVDDISISSPKSATPMLHQKQQPNKLT